MRCTKEGPANDFLKEEGTKDEVLNIEIGTKHPSTAPTTTPTATTELIVVILYCTLNLTVKWGVDVHKMIPLNKIDSPGEIRQSTFFELMFLVDEKMMGKWLGKDKDKEESSN